VQAGYGVITDTVPSATAHQWIKHRFVFLGGSKKAYKAAQVAVTTTAAELFASGPAPAYQVLLYSTVEIFVGPTSSVTSSTGFLVPATTLTPIPETGAEVDTLYAVTSSGTGTAYVLQVQ
jgi:hypothetical protein